MYFARTNIGEGPQTPECDNNAPLPRSANGWNVRTEKVGKTHGWQKYKFLAGDID